MKLVAVVILGAALVASIQQKAPRTSLDRVYTKVQAERGATQFAKLCSTCHEPGKTPPAGKDKGPELLGEKFPGDWLDRTLGEMMFTILTTMPNDGSAQLNETEAADLVAHILQANGYPDGAADLKYDARNDTIFVKQK